MRISANEYKKLSSEDITRMLSQEDAPQHKDQKEGKLQAQCVKAFRTGYPLLAEYMTHLKNEDPNLKRRMIGAAMGVVAGYPDLMLFVPAEYTETSMHDGKIAQCTTHFNGIALELKNGKKGQQSQEQKICQMRLEACGYKYVLVRSLDEFNDAVNDYVRHVTDQTLFAINRVNVEAYQMRKEAQDRKARKELNSLLAKAQ